MMNRNWLMAGLMFAAAVGAAGAHLIDDATFKPAGGETLKIGDTFSIAWSELYNHNVGTDIALSEDGGKTWKDIKNNYPDASNGAKTFNWIVAGGMTTTAKIRICQHDSPPAGKGCTDADDVSDPQSGTNGHYVLVSKLFTIAASAGVRATSGAASSFSIDFHPGSRNVDVSFGLTENKDVLLQVFNAQGELIANLLDGKQEAGSHRMSVSSDKLNATSGMLVFKLKAGEEIRTQSWNAAH